MRTGMQEGYAANREPTPRRSTFNVSENHKTTWDGSGLIPIYWDFLYPGEVRRGKVRAFIRLSNPLDYPLMDNAYITVHVFSTAIRNVWDNFRKFFGERESPGDSIDYTLPKYGTGNINLTGTGIGARLANYMGLPYVASFDSGDAHALPFRVYKRIWNYWYRDSSIQDWAPESTDDGPDNSHTEYSILYRGKQWDYFTNITPNPQRGESVTIGGEVEFGGASGDIGVYSDVGGGPRKLDDTGFVAITGSVAADANVLYPNTTINELRNAVAIHQFLERDNRAGQMFGDIITAHFGVSFQDSKYAPSFIAGGTAPFIFSPIPNQTQDTSATGGELGELGSIGMSTFEGADFTYRASEPEILMVIASVRADLNYQQGLNRKWSYNTRYDFVYPEFEGIGDQALLKKEIYYQNSSVDDEVLGYSPRYEEARIGINKITGEFQSDNALSLDVWHLAEDYVSAPSLNDSYIRSTPPFDRVMKSTTQDQFIGDFQCEMYSTKALSQRGVPGLARL